MANKFYKKPVKVQLSGWRLGMSCRPRHLGFDPLQEFPQITDTRIWWVGCVSVVYSPKMGPKGPTLSGVPRHLKKKKRFYKNFAIIIPLRMCNAILFLFLFLVSKNSSCLQILQSNLDLMHLNLKSTHHHLGNKTIQKSLLQLSGSVPIAKNTNKVLEPMGREQEMPKQPKHTHNLAAA